MADAKGYFTFSGSVHNLLFKDLTVSSVGAFVGLCFGVAAFTFLFELVKSLRHYHAIVMMRTPEDSDIIKNDESEIKQSVLSKGGSRMRKLKFHCLQTIFHMMQLTMGYMVMLIVMSYNVWFFITVLITTALCYYFHDYLLSQKPPVVPIETPTL